MTTKIDAKKIKDRFYVLYDFIVQNQGSNVFFEEMRRSIDNAYEKSDLKYLNRVNKELNVWLVEMFPPKEKKEISQLLKEKLGENVEQADLKRVDKINKVVKRGRINNLNEYSLLQQRVEEIYADESKKEEVEMLNKLLADFHK
ncbi:hypothetical protein [Gaoshiqia sp. Z1-71]|uniref:hypothetical protein n=1 Tax=Gaoshiqia hydrogeniformans TaxID=3290090 RepID=UPI003BF7D0A9